MTYNETLLERYAYFQGTTAPAIKGQSRYTPEKRLVDQPRFKMPFFKNYDLYPSNSEVSPGAGWNSILEYKSVKDFLNARRKKLKDKYKADDSYVMPDGEIKKALENRINFVKLAIDFPNDDTFTQIEPQNFSVYENSLGGVSGAGDAFPFDDFEGKSVDKLDFSRDYVDECSGCGFPNDKGAKECVKCKQPISAAQNGLYGLPDGITPESDTDTDMTKETHNPYYGTISNSKDSIEVI